MAAIALFTFAIVFNIVAQNNGLSTATRSFSDRFRTIQAHVDGNDQLPPIISFKSNDRIVISFDELAEEHSNLQYSLIHCNAEWKPDNLVESEFLDGFNYAEVGDFQYSRST
ncbi:type IX secretion system plug protein domain-containing protein, partial [uncultured Muribaculum sp.]